MELSIWLTPEEVLAALTQAALVKSGQTKLERGRYAGELKVSGDGDNVPYSAHVIMRTLQQDNVVQLGAARTLKERKQ